MPPQPSSSGHRRIALSIVGLCYLLPGLWSVVTCSGPTVNFWMAHLMAFSAAFVLIFWPGSHLPAGAAAFVMMLVCLWAVHAECGPYTGGGAAMAYVAVFLFGWPLSLAVGLGVGLFVGAQRKPER
ncbi:MAG: hypothetical protein NZ533_07015 [Casimicrobiaceae bacterium]|nr:hypothetical protein [Casimicrobiaceae bacterium]MDW8312260.1 hypothetical protein [Burkholderiales bacterium]